MTKYTACLKETLFIKLYTVDNECVPVKNCLS